MSSAVEKILVLIGSAATAHQLSDAPDRRHQNLKAGVYRCRPRRSERRFDHRSEGLFCILIWSPNRFRAKRRRERTSALTSASAQLGLVRRRTL